MGDKDKPLNDSPDLRDALRSIDAIGEDQTGVESPSSEDDRPDASTTPEQ
ncbi:MAG: hypothetical protein ABWY54_01795 [Glaciihabitans sp.]